MWNQQTEKLKNCHQCFSLINKQNLLPFIFISSHQYPCRTRYIPKRLQNTVNHTSCQTILKSKKAFRVKSQSLRSEEMIQWVILLQKNEVPSTQVNVKPICKPRGQIQRQGGLRTSWTAGLAQATSSGFRRPCLNTHSGKQSHQRRYLTSTFDCYTHIPVHMNTWKHTYIHTCTYSTHTYTYPYSLPQSLTSGFSIKFLLCCRKFWS